MTLSLPEGQFSMDYSPEAVAIQDYSRSITGCSLFKLGIYIFKLGYNTLKATGFITWFYIHRKIT